MPSRLFLPMSIVVLIVIVMSLPVSAQESETLVVSPDGPYNTIEAALSAARDGDVIEVYGGVYAAPLIVDKSVSLIGHDGAEIDGGGDGSIVIISAPDAVFRGFTVRNTGESLHHEDTGIIIQAPRALVADNTLEDVLFGIYFANADEGVARNNVIHGKALDLPVRGDGVRVWFSNNVTLDGNEVTTSRDTLIWYAEGITIENNHFHGNRYGLHFMYSSNATVQGNIFENNSVGTYLMYSQGLTLRENRMIHNRGPSGYGLALKDMDGVVATDNLFVANRAGIYLDNSPALYEGYNTFSANVFAYNDIGATMQPAVERNIFQTNSFIENVQQVSSRGRGDLQGNTWSDDGYGNYWSDYAGYDADEDSIGDMPYRYEKLFESLTDTYPELRLFIYSPAAQALDFAAAAFPSLRPEPKLVDEAPLVRPVISASLPRDQGRVSAPLLIASLVLIGLGGSVGVFALWFVFPRRANRDLSFYS